MKKDSFLFFHFNLFFSSVDKAQRKTIIKNCYYPILNIAKEHNIPINIEASARTLLEIKKIDKKFILQGLLVILSNPKAFLFLGAFIPQFIDINQPVANQIIFFGFLFMIVGAIFDGAYAIVFGKFRDCIINKYIGLLNKLGGSLLVFVGLFLLLS